MTHTLARTRPLAAYSRAGFSLVEMMMVMVVFGIVLAAAIPNIGHYMQKDYVRDTGKRFKVECQKAQQSAQRTRQSHRVVYEPDDRLFYTERWDHVSSEWVMASPDTVYLPASVEFDGGTPSDPTNHIITFEPLGTVAASDCPAQIEFTNTDYDSTSVSIVRTGRMIVRHR